MEDVLVVFDDEAVTEIRTHSAVLMLASPVFNRMLTQGMKEKENRRIELPGKNPKEFKILLEFLHPATSRVQKVSEDNVDFLLTWSDEYCIETLHRECLECAKSQPPSMDGVLRAYRWGLHDYMESCIDSLLRSGVKDWKACYAHPELVQKVLETLIANVKTRTSEISLYLPPKGKGKRSTLSGLGPWFEEPTLSKGKGKSSIQTFNDDPWLESDPWIDSDFWSIHAKGKGKSNISTVDIDWD